MTTTADDLEYCDPFARLPHLGRLTTPQFHQLLRYAGRNNRPALLFDAWFGHHIDRDTLAAVIGGVWSGAEYPDQNLDRASWRHLFRKAGFTVDGERADRPTEPLTLWRGSVPERRRDWSWSTDRKVAEGYANGTAAHRPKGRLYRVLAPAEALLCANNDREEAEYVVDTRGLRIKEQHA